MSCHRVTTYNITVAMQHECIVKILTRRLHKADLIHATGIAKVGKQNLKAQPWQQAYKQISMGMHSWFRNDCAPSDVVHIVLILLSTKLVRAAAEVHA